MKQLSAPLQFFITLARIQAVMSRRFDTKLGGLGFNELIILFHLHISSEGKVRRSDLATSIGFTASGITRLLLPMEKIGLIKRAADPHDARVQYVILAPGGKQYLTEGLERAEILMDDMLATSDIKKYNNLFTALPEFGKMIN